METRQAKIHVNSLKCVRVEILAEATKAHLGYASGSFWKFEDKIFLVTNWHVITGRNYQTSKIMHKSGAIPGYLNLEFHTIREAKANTFHHDEAVVNDIEFIIHQHVHSIQQNSMHVFRSIDIMVMNTVQGNLRKR